MSEVVSVQYDIDPAMVCGGVFVEDRGFVPVDLKEEYRDDAVGISLWEYAEPNGDVRACLLHVDEGRTSPRWYIKPDAGEGRYFELHQTVSGLGALVLERPEGQHTTSLPVMDGAPVKVLPGDVFSIQAKNNTPDSTGTSVLALFPGAPFKLSYEERVD